MSLIQNFFTRLLICVTFPSLIITNVSSSILDCKFHTNTIENDYGNFYECLSEYNFNFADKFLTNVDGNHLDSYQNENVTSLRIFQPISMETFPKSLSKFLPNIENLEIQNANLIYLTNVELLQFKNLKFISIYNVPIQTLEPKLFSSLTELITIKIIKSNVEFVHEDTFEELPELKLIKLMTKCTPDISWLKGSPFVNFIEDVLSRCSPEELIYCIYEIKVDKNSYYTCKIARLFDPFIFANVTGRHKDGKGDADVQEVDIICQTIKRIPEYIGITFPNLIALRIQGQISILTQLNFETFPNIEELYLENNLIFKIDSNTFEVTPKLRVINLERNHLVSLGIATFSMLKNLTHLNLDNNEKIHFHADTKEEMKSLIPAMIESGIVVHDSIQCLYAKVNLNFLGHAYTCFGINMKYAMQPKELLWIFFERIFYAFGDHLPEMTNKHVEALKLDHYNLKSFPKDLPNVLPNLKSITIVHSKMKTLYKKSFENFPHLMVVDLSYNELNIIPSGVFAKNPKLIFVDFKENNLHLIPVEIFGKNLEIQFADFYHNECTNATLASRYEIDEFIDDIADFCDV